MKSIINLFFLLNMCLGLFAVEPELSPRLLITLGPKCNFTGEELQKVIKAHYVIGNEKDILQKLIQSDQAYSLHILIIPQKLPRVMRLAKELGYDTLHLNCDFEKAYQKILIKFKEIPLTEKDLPSLSPQEVGLFYDLMMKVDKVFNQHHLTYWATCGTLLGMLRHQGMIPWDDDLDIAIFAQDIPLLKEVANSLTSHGLQLYYYSKINCYKIFFNNGLSIFDKKHNEYPWKYPFIDVFPLELIDDKYSYIYEKWQDFSRDYFSITDLQIPLLKMPFGPLNINVPHNAISYVKRMYGDDWDHVAYVQYSHKLEKTLTKIKVDLYNRSAPFYELP